MRATVMALSLALLAGTVASGNCLCVRCDHDAGAGCRSCEKPEPQKKSCCSKKTTTPQKPKAPCTHVPTTIKAPAHAPTPPAVDAVVAFAAPTDPTPAIDVIVTAPRAPERVRRKLFLLHSSILC